MLTHRSKKPYECAVDNCGKSYCDIRSLRRHFESQHAGLVMEDNMTYTGDEKDPELMAAEAAAVANRQGQTMLRGSPGADFIGLGAPGDMNPSSQDPSADSPGSSSSAALQSLALAAQRVQSTPDQSPSQVHSQVHSQAQPGAQPGATGHVCHLPLGQLRPTDVWRQHPYKRGSVSPYCRRGWHCLTNNRPKRTVHSSPQP